MESHKSDKLELPELLKQKEIKLSEIKYESSLKIISSEYRKKEISEKPEERKKFIENLFKLHRKADITETIINLEKQNDVYVFKKPKLLHSIKIKSSQSGDINIIHPSGLSSKIELKSSSRVDTTHSTQYEIEYKPETICIGFAVLKNSEISSISAIDVNETIKNAEPILKHIEGQEKTINSQHSVIKSNTSKMDEQEKTIKERNNEITVLQDHKRQLESIIKESEKTVSSLEKSKNTLIKESNEIELKFTTERNSIEATKKKNEDITRSLAEKELEIESKQKSIGEINKDIEKLRIEKSQFDNELAGYSNEGAKQSKAYYFLALIVMVAISVCTTYVLKSGIRVIDDYNSDPTISIFELIISRLPLTIGISIVLTFSFGLVYIMIKNIMKINSDRMRFLQASIIAKDIYYATEGTEGLGIAEREKIRQEAKIKIISKIFKNEPHGKFDRKRLEKIVDLISRK